MFAGVPTTVCTSPDATSVPMCAFIPKNHWFPFLVWCISGSRVPVRFSVELGARAMVASTAVPWRRRRPFASRTALIVARNPVARPCAVDL